MRENLLREGERKFLFQEDRGSVEGDDGEGFVHLHVSNMRDTPLFKADAERLRANWEGLSQVSRLRGIAQKA